MEKFYNSGQDECIVLERKENRALILLPHNSATPYVVPLEYIKGESSWWHGKYFEKLGEAYEYWKGEVS